MENKNYLDAIEPHKFNHWCERRMLFRKAEMRDWSKRLGLRKDLSLFEKDALYFHEITGCNGLEFVAFSNTRNDMPIIFKNRIILVPCFLCSNDSDGRNIEDPILKLTEQMTYQERFIYDGWMPIEVWDENSARKAVQYIDETLSIFALDINVFWEWEPKYSSQYIGSSYRIREDSSYRQFELLVQAMESLNEPDKNAIYRSLSWLNKSRLLKEPTGQFLFAILAIESLANHIDDCDIESILSEFKTEKLSKDERRKRREKCIEEILSKKLKDNPTEAIKEANDICIYGAKKRLESNLNKVFASNSSYVDLLFKKDCSGRSLWDLRSDIAHGKINTLSETEVNRIRLHIGIVEKLALNYISNIITSITKNSKATLDSFEPNNNVRPIPVEAIDTRVHMAYIYSNYHRVRGSENQLQY
jgi:hypothetical protein